MFLFNQDESYKKAMSDTEDFFYNFQFIKPSWKRILKPIMVVTQKNILDMFKIDLVNHRKARLALQVHLHGFSPSEIDNMWYMDFEFTLLDLSEYLKEKQAAEKEAYDKQKEKTPDYSKYSKGFKQPNFRSPKMPRY